jgi:hypothetical protein
VTDPLYAFGDIVSTRRAIAPDFLIVGTPRSGTTLVQRLACELPGVRVPPETHFFKRYAPSLLRRRRFPLDADALREEIDFFCRMETSEGLDLDANAVFERLGGRCDGAVELFSAIVRELSGPAKVCGEKTPEHLSWWHPLAGALPQLRFIAVVRDPRAVAASNLQLGWNANVKGSRRTEAHVQLSERWEWDQREVAKAGRELGPARWMTMRYEDVVAGPDAARRRIADFLGLDDGRNLPRAVTASELFRDRERVWKSRAVGPISRDRVDAWRSVLTHSQAADIVAICRAYMVRFGYAGSAPRAVSAFMRIAGLGAPSHLWRLRYRLSRARRRFRTNRALMTRS